MAEDIKTLRKTLDKVVEQYEELKKDYAITTKDLHESTLELSKVRRRVSQSKTDKTNAINTKLELDVEYKRITEGKRESEQKIREIMTKNAELQFALEVQKNNIVDKQQKKVKDIQEVEQQRESLKNHQREYDRELDQQRRELQAKFIEAKLEFKKTFQQEVDDLKIRHDKQLASSEHERRRIISEITENSEKKISTLKQQSNQLTTKLDQLNRTQVENEATIANLEKKLRRELLNVEVMGTSKIDWMKEQSKPPEIVRLFKSQEKKIQQLRHKLNEMEDEVGFESRQAEHASNTAKELERDLHQQQLHYQRLESTKDDLEKRLQQKIDERERELNADNVLLQADFANVQHQLQASIGDKEELIKALKLELSELTDLAKDCRDNNAQLSAKLAERLETDRVKFIELEKARREAVAEVRRSKKELEEFEQQSTSLEDEIQKYKKQYQQVVQQSESLLGNTQKLEKAERRLLTRV